VNVQFEDFPLARRQCSDMSANDLQLGLLAVLRSVLRNGTLDYPKKCVRWYRLGQNILRTRLSMPQEFS
jgi:hypothetical protein